jgi:3-hydroxybutyryl-CoA dehydrogenase
VSQPLPRAVAVVGAGTMGGGIALSFALAGCSVRLMARRDTSLETARRRIDASLELLVGHEWATPDEAKAARGRILATTALEEAVAGAGLVVETVTEDLEVKRDVLVRAEWAAGPGTILATDTSSIAVDELAVGLSRPGCFAGFHWFNPPELVELIEVVSGERTAPDTAAALVGWAEALGKVPVHVRRDVPGFVANRLQYALIREAYALVEAGVCSSEEVDRAVRAGLGARWAAIGPFETFDLAGLDVHLEVARRLFPELANTTEPPTSLVELVTKGALGCKSGRGLRGEYDEEDVRALQERRASVLLTLAGLRRRLTGSREAVQ